MLDTHPEAKLYLIDESGIAGKLIAGHALADECCLQGARFLADKLPITLPALGRRCAQSQVRLLKIKPGQFDLTDTGAMTGPGILRSMYHHVRLHRIAFHVAPALQQILLSLDGTDLVPALPPRPATSFQFVSPAVSGEPPAGSSSD